MRESELAAIESRSRSYPADAQRDILALAVELRRLRDLATERKAPSGSSPLYDQPTGLLNSGAYGVRFAMARARATRYRKIFAVMSVEVNLVPLQKEQRDPAIKAFAGRLESCLRATDTLARLGDNAFAIILEDLTQPDHAERVQHTVQGALAEPLQLGPLTIDLQTKVTLQFYPGPAEGAPVKYDA